MTCTNGCNQKCVSTASCNCSCENNTVTENCNDCINQESITFNGLCDPTQYDIDTKMWSSLSITGTIAVPECQLSIEEVDKIDARVEILRQTIIDTPISLLPSVEGKYSTGKKLIVEGLVCLGVSYVGLIPEQTVNYFNGQIPFSTFVVIPTEFCNDYQCLVETCLEDVRVKRVCDRTIDLSVSMLMHLHPVESTCGSAYYSQLDLQCNLGVGFTECTQKECFTDKPDIKGVCPVAKIKSLLNDGSTQWAEVSIPELLSIPDAKPDIYQIASINSRIEIMCQQVIQTPVAVPNYEGVQLTGYKLLVHALLRQRITYISTSDCGSVHSAHYDIPISIYIVLDSDDVDLSDKFYITACIEYINACPLNERQIFKNTTIFIKANAIDECVVG